MFLGNRATGSSGRLVHAYVGSLLGRQCIECCHVSFLQQKAIMNIAGPTTPEPTEQVAVERSSCDVET